MFRSHLPPILRLSASLLLTGTWIAWVPAANAATIFSNLGPGDSFNSTQGVTVGSFAGPKAEQAVSLTPSQAIFLDSVEVPLRAFAGSATVNILLAASAAGGSQPGNSTSALDVAQVMAPGTGGLVTGVFSGTIALQAGTTYWIWLSAPQSGDASGWLFNDTGSTRTWFTSTDFGVNWSVHGGVEPAIRINGTPVAEQVPALSTWGYALLAGLLAGAVWMVRWRLAAGS